VRGLSSSEAANRLAQYGPNRLQPANQQAALLQLQSYRAGRAAEQLALQMAVTATVLRDGERRKLPVTELVPGDVVQLSAGNLVPADARLLEAEDFFVNQAQLTGEPYPVEKRAAPASASAANSRRAPHRVRGLLTGLDRQRVHGQFRVVIFVIRTRRNTLRSHPNRWLLLSSLGVVVTAMTLPFTPIAHYLGFTALPASFFGLLAAVLISYLLMVEGGKQWFYRRLTKA